MTALELKAINMLGQFSEDKLFSIIAFMEGLQEEGVTASKPRIGAGVGKTTFPADIDFCNEEVAELFYGAEK